jgi:hypothetical protein
MGMTRIESSEAVQAAVRAAGGQEHVVDLIHAGWVNASAAGRLAGLREAISAAHRELKGLDPLSDRAAALRADVQRYSSEIGRVERENDTASRQTARQCVAESLGGEPYWLLQLAAQAARVNIAFSDAINAAL